MWVYEHEASQYRCHRDGDHCQGRRCMAWRWGFINRIENPAAYDGQSFSAEDIGVTPNKKFPPEARFRGRKGFCGLAGQPKE